MTGLRPLGLVYATGFAAFVGPIGILNGWPPAPAFTLTVAGVIGTAGALRTWLRPGTPAASSAVLETSTPLRTAADHAAALSPVPAPEAAPVAPWALEDLRAALQETHP